MGESKGIWIRTKHVKEDTDRKYEALVKELFLGIDADFARMMNNPNFQRFIKDISDDIDRDDPDFVLLTQKGENYYEWVAGRTYDCCRYHDALSVNGRHPSDYGLPDYFDTEKSFLGFAYSLFQQYDCQAVSISETTKSVDEEIFRYDRNHLFLTISDFRNYLNDTFGYRKSTGFSKPIVLFEDEYIFQRKGLFAPHPDYGIIEKCIPHFIPTKIVLYRRYVKPPESQEKKPSWY